MHAFGSKSIFHPACDSSPIDRKTGGIALNGDDLQEKTDLVAFIPAEANAVGLACWHDGDGRL